MPEYELDLDLGRCPLRYSGLGFSMPTCKQPESKRGPIPSLICSAYEKRRTIFFVACVHVIPAHCLYSLRVLRLVSVDVYSGVALGSFTLRTR